MREDHSQLTLAKYIAKRRGSCWPYPRSTHFTSTRHKTAPSAAKTTNPPTTVIATRLASVSRANTSSAMVASKPGSPMLGRAQHAGTSSQAGCSSKMKIPGPIALDSRADIQHGTPLARHRLCQRRYRREYFWWVLQVGVLGRNGRATCGRGRPKVLWGVFYFRRGRTAAGRIRLAVDCWVSE